MNNLEAINTYVKFVVLVNFFFSHIVCVGLTVLEF